MKRDEEIQRLVNYIKGLGLEVTFSSKKSDAAAHWYLDNTGIVVFKKNNSSKIETVLSLIHEIAHAKHCIWEKDRKVDLKFEEALDHVDGAELEGTDTKKKQRKIILDNEIAGTKYWEEIYKETNMQFPIWRLEAAKEFDIYQYQVFYETGSYPKFKERKKKHKEVMNKHRSKNE
jgi:hypothetical protein